MATSNHTIPRLCLDCAADISHRGVASKRCVDCRQLRDKQRQNNWRKAKLINNPEWRESINARQRADYREIVASQERKEALRSTHRIISLRWYRRNGARPEIVEQRNGLRRQRYATDKHYRSHQLDYNRLRRRKWDSTVNREAIAHQMECQRGRCANCRKGIRKGYHLDHIFPLAQGGQSTLANLQLLCRRCNSSKGDKLVYYPPDGGQGRMALGI